MSAGVPLMVRWLSRVGVIPRAAVAQLDVQHTPKASSVLDAARLAEQTYVALDRLGHDVVLLARMGQNLQQFKLKYSHLGFAVRGLRRGDWAVVHLLNADDGMRSGIYQEGLVNFYSDQPYRFEAAIVALPASVQAAVKAMLLAHAKRLHMPSYSLTAYPWQLDVQNSNQWALELLASALREPGDAEPTRAKAQAWLREHGYTPSRLTIALPTQWAGPLLRDSIRFADQPQDCRRTGLVQTVTVDSVVDWLQGTASPFAAERDQVKVIELAL